MTDSAPSIAPTDHAMPKPVWVSLAMLLLQVPISLIYLLFFEPVEFGLFSLAFAVVFTLLALGFIALLAMGYGWVRHFYLVCTVLCLLPLILLLPRLFHSLPQLIHSLPMNGVWVLAMNLWFYAALALLYSPSARAWYRDARLQRQRGL